MLLDRIGEPWGKVVNLIVGPWSDKALGSRKIC